MLASLVTYNSKVTSIYNEVIDIIKCQLHLLNFEECLIQERQEDIDDIYVRISVPILMLSYLCWDRKNIQYIMLASPTIKMISIHKFDQ